MNFQESTPLGTYSPETPATETILGSDAAVGHQDIETVDILARVIGERIRHSLSRKLECHGLHRNRPIFTRRSEMGQIQPLSQVQASLPSLETNVDVFERLALDIERLLYQKLVLEQERRTHTAGRLPW
jgi:hypothetical protein